MTQHFTGSAVAGAAGFAIGLAAAHARKAAAQAPSVVAGDWADALAAEHRMVEALFDKLLATDDSQGRKRATLLSKIAYALNKHGIAEENVIYPELRQRAGEEEARHLFEDHAEIKVFIHRLRMMDSATPGWRALAEAFRDHVVTHAREEEEVIFPALKARLSETENARLTKLANWEAFKVA